MIVAPLLAPADPMRTDPANQLQAAERRHLLGTDLLGRDVLSRALYGGQHTLLIAALATADRACCPACCLACSARMTRRIAGSRVLHQRVLAFPGLLLALLMLTLLGQGALPLALATGVTQIAPCARVTRSAVIGVRSSGYVEAARGLGATRLRLVMLCTSCRIFSRPCWRIRGVIFAYAILNSAALEFSRLGWGAGHS